VFCIEAQLPGRQPLAQDNSAEASHKPVSGQSGRRRRAFALASRPPLKLHVRFSRMQLSRRLSDARMQEKVLNRATGQARTRRTTWSRAAVSSLRCANVGTDATKFAAGSNRRDVGRVFGPGRVCNTRLNPARADSAPQSAPWSDIQALISYIRAISDPSNRNAGPVYAKN
jgi:hypothetical protein